MRSAAATRNAQANAACALLNNGTIKLYSGTRPATADTALSGNTLLATGTFGATAFGAASAGAAVANAITQESNAPAGGTATFARLSTSGAAAVADVSVGTSGTELIINSTTIVAGLIVTFNSLTYTQPDGT
jgi:hypothetical protein